MSIKYFLFLTILNLICLAIFPINTIAKLPSSQSPWKRGLHDAQNSLHSNQPLLPFTPITLWEQSLAYYSLNKTYISTPVIGMNGKLYIGIGHHLFSFDTDGKQIYTLSNDSITSWSPSIGDQGAVLVNTDQGLFTVAPDTNKTLSFISGGSGLSSPVQGNSKDTTQLIFYGCDGMLCAASGPNPLKLHWRWEKFKSKTLESSPAFEEIVDTPTKSASLIFSVVRDKNTVSEGKDGYRTSFEENQDGDALYAIFSVQTSAWQYSSSEHMAEPSVYTPPSSSHLNLNNNFDSVNNNHNNHNNQEMFYSQEYKEDFYDDFLETQIVFTSTFPSGSVIAIEATSGVELWHDFIKGEADTCQEYPSSVAVGEDRVYASCDGTMTAFSLQEDVNITQYSIDNNGDSQESDFIDTDNTHVLWRYNTNERYLSSPTITKNENIIFTSASQIYALSSNGTLIWSLYHEQFKFKRPLSAPIINHGGLIHMLYQTNNNNDHNIHNNNNDNNNNNNHQNVDNQVILMTTGLCKTTSVSPKQVNVAEKDVTFNATIQASKDGIDFMLNKNATAQCIFGENVNILGKWSLIGKDLISVKCILPQPSRFSKVDGEIPFRVTFDADSQEDPWNCVSRTAIHFYGPITVSKFYPPGVLSTVRSSLDISGSDFTANGNKDPKLRKCRYQNIQGEGKEVYTRAKIISDTKALCQVPLNEKGIYSVSLTIDGQTFIKAPDNLIIYDAPIVHSLTPSLGPKSGSTSVMVHGDRFINQLSQYMKCRFGGSVSNASYFNSTTIQCSAKRTLIFDRNADEIPIPDESMQVSDNNIDINHGLDVIEFSDSDQDDEKSEPFTNVSFELALNGEDFQKSSLEFIFYTSPILKSIEPYYVYMNQLNTTVTIKGEYFWDSKKMKCLFGTQQTEGFFMDSNQIGCYLPPNPQPGKVLVDLSMNGGIDFASRNNVTFTFRKECGGNPPCSGHGDCNMEGHCECYTEWSGEICDQKEKGIGLEWKVFGTSIAGAIGFAFIALVGLSIWYMYRKRKYSRLQDELESGDISTAL